MGFSMLKVYIKTGQYTKIAAMIVRILYTIDFKVVGIIIYQTKNGQYRIKTDLVDKKPEI